MESSSNLFKEKNKENERIKSSPSIKSLKSDYFLQKLFDNMPKKKKLEIVRCNKRMQNRLDLGIKDYKEYSETFTPIEIEIIPIKDKYGRFIKFIKVDKNDELYYHIYLFHKIIIYF